MFEQGDLTDVMLKRSLCKTDVMLKTDVKCTLGNCKTDVCMDLVKDTCSSSSFFECREAPLAHVLSVLFSGFYVRF
jgi:hypothetical protein